MDHHIVISADTHCGADLRGYRPYLESRYHEEFDEWAAFMDGHNERRKAMFADMERSPDGGGGGWRPRRVGPPQLVVV